MAAYRYIPFTETHLATGGQKGKTLILHFILYRNLGIQTWVFRYTCSFTCMDKDFINMQNDSKSMSFILSVI
jgi:hypothetical protein